MERTQEEIQADEAKHQKKHEEIDVMKEKNRIKNERMERINPKDLDFPALSVEEVDAIEKDLPPGEFTDADIIDVVTRKVPQKRGQVEEMVNSRKKAKADKDK